MSTLAILVPILNRPHRIEPLLQSIAEGTADVQHRVIFGCSDQPSVDILDRLGCAYIRDEGGAEGTWPKRINRLVAATNESYVFCSGDDLDYRPGWFQAALVAMNQLPDGSGVVAINDTYNANGVHYLIARSYIEKFGVIDEPGKVACESYQHQFVDDEIRATAKFHGRWAYAQDAVVEHLHVGAGKAPMDETYRIGEASAGQGHAIFMSRKHLWESV